MAEIVNLNRFRKAKARAADEKQATENRIRFGRTKAEKQAAKAETERAARIHDGGRLDSQETNPTSVPEKDGAC